MINLKEGNELSPFIEKAIKIGKALQPSQNTYHCAFAFRRNRLLAIGLNSTHKPCLKAFKIAKRFKNEHFKKYSYLHAEIDVVARLWGREHIDGSMKIVVLRFNLKGDLMNSKPCKNCAEILRALNVHKIWWSNENNGISFGI